MILLLKENRTYFFLIIGILILSISLFFPVSSDLAAFIQGGMILNNGGSLYVDYFDVKPPFVYYFFELLYSIFGKNIFLYRLFDFFYQSIFLLSSVYIFSKLQLNNKYTKLYLVIIPLSYVTMNYSSLFQMESLLFLPIIWYYYLVVDSNKNNFRITILKGLLLGIMINLKYTFGLVFLISIISNLLNPESKNKSLIYILLELFIGVLTTLVCFLPVLVKGNLSAFLDFFVYMRVYSSYPNWSMEYIISFIKTITDFYSNNLSLAIFLSFLFALFHSNEKSISNFKDSKLFYATLFTIFLFITIIIERKGMIYHNLRVYPFLILISSIGLDIIWNYIKDFKKSLLISLFFLVVIFSPIPRFINILMPVYYYFSNSKADYYNSFNDGDDGMILNKQSNTANYINLTFPNKECSIINTGGNEMIVFLDKDYNFAFPHSAFYLNSFAPDYIRNKALHQLYSSDILVIQKNDNSHIMFFNNDNSIIALNKDLRFLDYINTNFRIDTTIDNTFIIYKRLGIE